MTGRPAPRKSLAGLKFVAQRTTLAPVRDRCLHDERYAVAVFRTTGTPRIAVTRLTLRGYAQGRLPLPVLTVGQGWQADDRDAYDGSPAARGARRRTMSVSPNSSGSRRCQISSSGASVDPASRPPPTSAVHGHPQPRSGVCHRRCGEPLPQCRAWRVAGPSIPRPSPARCFGIVRRHRHPSGPASDAHFLC